VQEANVRVQEAIALSNKPIVQQNNGLFVRTGAFCIKKTLFFNIEVLKTFTFYQN